MPTNSAAELEGQFDYFDEDGAGALRKMGIRLPCESLHTFVRLHSPYLAKQLSGTSGGTPFIAFATAETLTIQVPFLALGMCRSDRPKNHRDTIIASDGSASCSRCLMSSKAARRSHPTRPVSGTIGSSTIAHWDLEQVRKASSSAPVTPRGFSF